MPEHAHPEAFKMMEYRSDDGHESLFVYNTRDGVTPFVITLPSGKQATHVEWQNDQYLPEHQPGVGDWVFVDLTLERAQAAALRNAERHWNDPAVGHIAKAMYADIDALATVLLEDYERDAERGAPDLIQVTEDLVAR